MTTQFVKTKSSLIPPNLSHCAPGPSPPPHCQASLFLMAVESSFCDGGIFAKSARLVKTRMILWALKLWLSSQARVTSLYSPVFLKCLNALRPS